MCCPIPSTNSVATKPYLGDHLMALLVALPPLLLLTILVVGYILNRDRIFEIVRALQNGKAFSSFSALAPREMIPLLQSDSSNDPVEKHIVEGILNLASYAKVSNLIGLLAFIP